MIDLVHDVAEGYRNLVSAASYPGDVRSLKEQIVKQTLETPFGSEILLFGYMLLDADVSFAVVGDRSNTAGAVLSRYTYSKETSVGEADFIFILKDATHDECVETLSGAKVGTLVDPHQSAILVMEVDSVREGDSFLLEGPGIRGMKQVWLSLFTGWEDVWESVNREYPLGIDLYLVDAQSNLMALPRTVSVKKEATNGIRCS